MTVTLVNTSSYASVGNATTHTCTITAPTAGHKLIAAVAKQATQTGNTAGWTRVSAATDVDSVEIDQYERWSDGTETQFQVTLGVGGNCVIDVFEWAGLQNAPADVAAHNQLGASSSSSLATGTTASAAQAVELAVAMFCYLVAPPGDTFTPPPGWTLLHHAVSTNVSGQQVFMDTCYFVTVVQFAVSATGTYNAAHTHKNANVVAYLAAATPAAGQIYPLAKQSWLTQSPSIDMDTAVIKAAVGRTADGFAFNGAHQFFSDISAVMVSSYATAVTIPGVTAPSGAVLAGSATILFPVNSGADLDFLVLFKDGGSAATSPLIAFMPFIAPVTPANGRVVQVQWNQGAFPNGLLFTL